jgi:hypothetical protein
MFFGQYQIPCPDFTGQGNKNAKHEKTYVENNITSLYTAQLVRPASYDSILKYINPIPRGAKVPGFLFYVIF